MSIGSVSAPSLHGHATENSHANDLEFSVQSLNKVLTSITKAQLRVHAASDELQILLTAEEQLHTLYCEGRAALRYRRNQLAPINRLPDDVLLIIFVMAPNENQIWEMLRYLPLTWICRRWRHLAVDSPVLWNLVDLAYIKKHRELFVEVSRRSNNTKLSVGHLGPIFDKRYEEKSSTPQSHMGWLDNGYHPLSQDSEEFEAFKQYIAPNLRRVENLELMLRPSQFVDALFFLRDISLSIRRFRILEMPYMVRPEIGQMHPEDCNNLAFFQSRIFNMPMLQVLMIQSDHFTIVRIPKPLQVTNLRILILRYRNVKTTSNSPSLEELLHVVESCCHVLEFLRLSVLPPSAGTPLPTCSRITMPRLSSIILEDYPDTEILEYLSAPVLEVLSIDGRDISKTNLISHFVDLAALPCIKVDGDNIMGFKKDCQGIQKLTSTEATLHIKLPATTLDTSLAPGLIFQLSEWAAYLHSITLNTNNWGGTSMLSPVRVLLCYAQSLQSIKMGNADCIEIFELLNDPTICPNLESLDCVWAHSSSNASPGKELTKMARSRHRGKAPGLKELTIHGSHTLTQKQSDALKKWVEKYTHIKPSSSIYRELL